MPRFVKYFFGKLTEPKVSQNTQVFRSVKMSAEYENLQTLAGEQVPMQEAIKY